METSNIDMMYSMYYQAIDRGNGKMYTITVGGWILIPEKTGVNPFPTAALIE